MSKGDYMKDVPEMIFISFILLFLTPLGWIGMMVLAMLIKSFD